MKASTDLVNYLSKEIECHTAALMTFRTRIGFTFFVGPFVLLGSYVVGTKSIPFVDNWGTPQVLIAAALLLLLYVTFGYIGGRIERHMWRQCNVWRQEIAALTQDENMSEEAAKARADRYCLREAKLVPIWILSCVLFVMTFGATVFLMTSVLKPAPTDPPNKSLLVPSEARDDGIRDEIP